MMGVAFTYRRGIKLQRGSIKMSSKRGGRRRKRVVVDPPRSDDLEYSPPESVKKKPRLMAKTDSGAALETECRMEVTSSQTSCSSLQIAAAASRLAACGKAPYLWSVEEVVEFMGKSGLPASVAEAFKGAILICN
jgi:hypothetical protein